MIKRTIIITVELCLSITVAGHEFSFGRGRQWRFQDLTLVGAWTLSTEGGGRKSMKVLKVEVKVIFKRVLTVFLFIKKS